MVVPSGTAYREYLWVIPFVYGALVFAASIWWIVTGTPFDQLTYEKIVRMPWSEAMRAFDPRAVRLIGALFRELGGNFGILAGLLTMAISANSFRNGERWAWYALWILPIHSALDLVTVIGYGAISVYSLLWDIFLIATTALSLGLSFGRCFAIVERGPYV